MNTLTLPALDGRKALGFLAAVGVTRLLSVYGDDSPSLAWSVETSAAILRSRYKTVQELATGLLQIVDSIPEGSVLPGVPAEMPPPGAAPDGLRLAPADLRRLIEQLAPGVDSEVEAWCTSLVTDLSLDKAGRCAISMMAAPSGKQSMRTMLEKPLAEVREDPSCILEALVGWRRRPGVTGEYLDHQVLFDAADSGAGESRERGVPGATWLALMSYPMFRTTAFGSEPLSTGWHRRSQGPATFLYPLWSSPLGCDAIAALLEHPIWERSLNGAIPPGASAFSVFAVHLFQRRQISGRTFAGVLGPAR